MNELYIAMPMHRHTGWCFLFRSASQHETGYGTESMRDVAQNAIAKMFRDEKAATKQKFSQTFSNNGIEQSRKTDTVFHTHTHTRHKIRKIR